MVVSQPVWSSCLGALSWNEEQGGNVDPAVVVSVALFLHPDCTNLWLWVFF